MLLLIVHVSPNYHFLEWHLKKKKKSTTCNCVCLSLIREEDFDSNIYSVGFRDLCQTVTAQGHAIRDQQKK